MRTLVVDDEPLMLKRFQRLSQNLPEVELSAMCRDPLEALEYVKLHEVDLAFLDIGMPVMNGLELAQALREIRQDLLIVFITAYDDYIREANRIGCDYYIVKPYERETLEKVVENMRLLSQRQKKPIFIQTFGIFNIYKDGRPIVLRGKAKEILALVVAQCGREISNEEIYSTLWENRSYSHDGMKLYFNALRRLRDALAAEQIENLLISTARGQMIDSSQIDCDYYDFKECKPAAVDAFEGKFLEEYSWGEAILADLIN